MTIHETFDLILKELSSNEYPQDSLTMCKKLGFKSYLEYLDIQKQMLSAKLIEKDLNYESKIKISSLGSEVIKIGSYDRYIELENGRIAREFRDIDKSHYDYKLSKLQYHLFWPVTIMALLGFLYASIDFICKLFK